MADRGQYWPHLLTRRAPDRKFVSVIADNLRYARRKLGLTQQQMADQLSIKRSLLGAYEEGRATPRLEVLQQLAPELGVSVAQLLNTDLAAADPAAPAPPERPRGRPRLERPPVAAAPRLTPRPPSAARVSFESPYEAPYQPYDRPDTVGPMPAVESTPLPHQAQHAPVAPRPEVITGPTACTYVPAHQARAYAGHCHQPHYLAGLEVALLPWLEALTTPGVVYRLFEFESASDGPQPRLWLICERARHAGQVPPHQGVVVVGQGMIALGSLAAPAEAAGRLIFLGPLVAPEATTRLPGSWVAPVPVLSLDDIDELWIPRQQVVMTRGAAIGPVQPSPQATLLSRQALMGRWLGNQG